MNVWSFIMLSVHHLTVFQRPLLRRVCCCGVRGRLPPTGTWMCRTSTSGDDLFPQDIFFFSSLIFQNNYNSPPFHNCSLLTPLSSSTTFLPPFWFFPLFFWGSAGRTAWLCVLSSTDTDLTWLTTPNWERCSALSPIVFISFLFVFSL